mmetsp:Transcript_28200/g.43443  ORF Transcript_28200/g.43443 Transcript_28200/m.43443 type:complete len:163 (-) Transcript_28200:121-609(-)|eukprot:CAMPEP_0117034486 /NCGR_PEP_ID=MMETSP0472-20121206/24549_1 /TAXON_ID=693140 ORGANISM="Tiarina fusus, Strain LIS" /NCGR_SAMPLE_ID=MMETSP0472 /ASSEMBLY_ACC=CAM_ASM_000603 /LENGTH=162 /DNA_ID=CAMNT_0004743669 /DNA_START=73 /DNA_END=561 /DNA_ORIENTATION=+
MVADMSYSTVSYVIDSWEAVRRLPDYEEIVGKKLFIKLFQLEPDAKAIFGFGKIGTGNGEELPKELIDSKRFTTHAKYFIQMIDKALGMLGPDIELLTEILLDLGKKHVNYGVKPEYFPSMGRALIHSVQTVLGDGFTEDMKDAWVEVYGALSYDMIRGQKM